MHLGQEIRKRASAPARLQQDSAACIEDLGKRLTPTVWAEVLRTFKPQKTLDGLGWSQDILHYLASHAQMATSIRELVMLTIVQRDDDVFLKLTGASKAIPLIKDHLGALRPISVPTVWRKAGASWIQKAYAEDFKQMLGHQQYGAHGRVCQTSCVTWSRSRIASPHGGRFRQTSQMHLHPLLDDRRMQH